jgi:hypothetical protein
MGTDLQFPSGPQSPVSGGRTGRRAAAVIVAAVAVSTAGVLIAVSADRPARGPARVRETADRAARGERANQPRPH